MADTRATAAASARPAAEPTGDHRVVLRGVAHTYQSRGIGTRALAEIDLEVGPGEFVALVGPSGCGKTTLLNILAGFISPSQGQATVGGEAIHGPGPQRGVVFQQPNLYPWLSVRENVAFGPRMRRTPRSERHAIADRYLRLVGLADFAHARPYELSGGMQQRCQIARVLAGDPAIMLLDEPFGALDAMTRERLQDELHRVWLGSGKTAFFITHSVEEAVYLGTRVLVMSPRPGRVVFDETSPFARADRDRGLRTEPTFVGFRERVSGSIADAVREQHA